MTLAICFNNTSSTSFHKQDGFDLNYEVICYTLKVVENNLSERKKLYSQLYFTLLDFARYHDNVRPVSWHLKQAVKRRNIHISIEMPFIQYLLKTMGKSSKRETENMLAFKNSLAIVNHFEKN